MKPYSGKIFIEGRDVTSLNEYQLNIYRQKYIGYSFQEPLLIPYLTVLENILISIRPYLKQNILEEYIVKAKNIINRLGLGGLEKRFPNELSTGERKRVDLARALIRNPKILILDEPTANVDEETGTLIRNILMEEMSKDTAIIYSVHWDQKLKGMAKKTITMTKYV